MTPSTPLDDVEFLARSAHRIEVLRTLAAGPRSRPDLHEVTGVSQPTLGRILGDFEDRRWVEREGREYALTALGELVAEAFEDLVATVETVQAVGDVVARLPTGEMGFDLRELADATVTRPAEGDAFRHVRRLEQLLYGADRVRNLAPTIALGTPEDFSNRWRAFLDGDQHVEGIISAGTLQGMSDDDLVPDTPEFLREALATDRVQLYLYDGEIPLLLGVADGTAILAPTDDQDVPVAVVETDDETVLAWAEATLDEYRAQSTEITIEDVPS